MTLPATENPFVHGVAGVSSVMSTQCGHWLLVTNRVELNRYLLLLSKAFLDDTTFSDLKNKAIYLGLWF